MLLPTTRSTLFPYTTLSDLTNAAENYYYRVMELDPSLTNRAEQGLRRARIAAAGVEQLADIADAEREAWDAPR